MSDREAFEKWILQDYVEDYIRKEPLHGCYAHPLIEDYWNAWEPSWKASRAQAIDECAELVSGSCENCGGSGGIQFEDHCEQCQYCYEITFPLADAIKQLKEQP